MASVGFIPLVHMGDRTSLTHAELPSIGTIKARGSHDIECVEIGNDPFYINGHTYGPGIWQESVKLQLSKWGRTDGIDGVRAAIWCSRYAPFFGLCREFGRYVNWWWKLINGQCGDIESDVIGGCFPRVGEKDLRFDFFAGHYPYVESCNPEIGTQFSLRSIITAFNESLSGTIKQYSSYGQDDRKDRNKSGAESIEPFFIGYYPALKSRFYFLRWLFLIFGPGLALLFVAIGGLNVGIGVLLLWLANLVWLFLGV
jgi:hypothetical protein